MWKPRPWTAVRELARWPVTTQFGARRNALLGCTEVAQRRREHDDIESLLSEAQAPDAALPASPDRQTPASM
jgi:hypothetical protein